MPAGESLFVDYHSYDQKMKMEMKMSVQGTPPEGNALFGEEDGAPLGFKGPPRDHHAYT